MNASRIETIAKLHNAKLYIKNKTASITFPAAINESTPKNLVRNFGGSLLSGTETVALIDNPTCNAHYARAYCQTWTIKLS